MRITLLLLALAACGGHAAKTDAGAGGFACGSASCAPGTEYCYVTASGVAGVAPAGAPGCNPVPAACGVTLDCNCLVADTTCNTTPACSGSNGAFTVTCSNP